MKKILYAALVLALSAGFTACQKDGGDGNKSKGNKYFDFGTTKVGNIKVQYNLAGYRSGILFEVYAEDPTPVEGRDAIKPIFKAYTNNQGYFSDPICLPTYLKKVFISTDAYVAGSIAEVAVVNGSIDFDVNKLTAPASAAASRAAYTVPNGFYTLGTWAANGYPDYAGERKAVHNGLMTEINNILKEGQNLANNSDYLLYDGTDESKYVYNNIDVTADCQIDLMFLFSRADLYNAVGYYTYPTGSRPANPSLIEHRTIAYPVVSGKAGHPLVGGDNVKLKYWNGTEYVDTFPAGVTIGFFLLPGTFSNGNVTDVTLGNFSPIYSDQQFNCLFMNPNGNKRQQTVTLYNKPRELVVISFEDVVRGSNHWWQDNDFNDAIFACVIDPYTAIDPNDDHHNNDLDPNDPDPVGYEIEYEGTLAFEDLWPSQGDYDMNDVGLRYYSKVYYDANNKIYKSEDTFTPVCKGGSYANGFGFQYGVTTGKVTGCTVASTNGAPAHSFYPVTTSALEPGMSKATVMLFDDANDQVDNNGTDGIDKSAQTSLYSYTVTTTYSNIETKELGFPPYNPFIVVQPTASEDQRSREVHLTNYAPTQKCTDPNNEWFGKQDDKSDKVNYWYVSEFKYPFAINIPTMNFSFPDECQNIDEAYPSFSNWVATKGAQDADWWKHRQ